MPSIAGLDTVTLQVAVFSSMVRVMSVVPSARAVTVPSSAMVATVLSLESHAASWLVAFSGLIV